MKSSYVVAISLIAGAAVGAAAIQGLHAQAKPKAYLVTESEVLDRAAVPPYGSVLSPAMQTAGGHWIGGASGPTEKITAVIGDPPKRFGVAAGIRALYIYFADSSVGELHPAAVWPGQAAWVRLFFKSVRVTPPQTFPHFVRCRSMTG